MNATLMSYLLGCGLMLVGSVVLGVGRTASWYVEPSIGFSTMVLRAVEIENSFVTSLAQTDEAQIDDWSNIDPNGVVASVGRMVHYRGTGMDLGISTGFKISGLQFGVAFSWLNAGLSGYSKRYRYVPELLRAGGRKLYDAAQVNIYRILGMVKYGIPVWKLLVNIQTRVGSLRLGQSALIVGRAVEKSSAAFYGDVGLEVSLRPNRWFGVGVCGTAGLFLFAGKYEGAMGGVFGGSGVLKFYF